MNERARLQASLVAEADKAGRAATIAQTAAEYLIVRVREHHIPLMSIADLQNASARLSIAVNEIKSIVDKLTIHT